MSEANLDKAIHHFSDTWWPKIKPFIQKKPVNEHVWLWNSEYVFICLRRERSRHSGQINTVLFLGNLAHVPITLIEFHGKEQVVYYNHHVSLIDAIELFTFINSLQKDFIPTDLRPDPWYRFVERLTVDVPR